ncbi:MAG: homoserine dehydrogenase [Ottowia sp.]|nr:homoserine dehydrogenase [Ottowia sp.]
MKPVRVGLVGLGTVGAGVFQTLRDNHDEILRRVGCDIVVTMACRRDLAEARAIVGEQLPLTTDPHEVIASPDVDVVVELIGGVDAARELVLAAIAAGKHVVTANKALLAVHGNEIFAAAQERGVMVAFEAAVAGGIPIIKALRESLAANRIEWIAGIINGTTNFILSQMRDKAVSFDEALAEAQALGYAEADPSFDIQGTDAAHKAAIMSAIAFGIPVQFDKAYVEGIEQLSGVDIRYAEQMGYRIKLLGLVRRRGTEGVELRVHPTLVPARRLIANVEGVMNAVMVRGDVVGTTLYYGEGAGASPTASAVIADLVDVARTARGSPLARVPHLAFQPEALRDEVVLPMEQAWTGYYLRLLVLDQAGVLARVATILAESGISVGSLLQREAREVGGEGSRRTDLIILTHEAREGAMNEALALLQALPAVLAPIVRIRKEELV